MADANLIPLWLRVQLRAVTLCDEDTIKRWWANRGDVRPSTDERLTRAAHELGMQHPDDNADVV